jgi:hypothetical protein
MADDRDLFETIERSLKLQIEEARREEAKVGSLDNKWTSLLHTKVKSFINEDLSLNRRAMENFRSPGANLMIPDNPSYTQLRYLFGGFLKGGMRGERKMLIEILELLLRLGDGEVLRRHPVPRAGNPNVFRYKGYVYTIRWLRHIRMLSLFNKFLKNKIGEKFNCMDIGSGWGMFSYILAKEMPRSTNVLLDFPEMLILAHYFLAKSFPSARIASYEQLMEQKTITRDFISQYDFVLIPHFLYTKIDSRSIDLIVNVASFGEMRREWFNHYIQNDPFKSSRFVMMSNRFESAPIVDQTYDTDLTILDYPLRDFKPLRFGVNPIFSHIYDQKWKFFYKRHQFSSQYFEFVGSRE